MEKKFNIKDDYLEVIAIHNDTLKLPTESGQLQIGTYEQTTIQKIDKDKIESLYEFIKVEKDKAQKQIDSIEEQLKPLKDVQEIDSNVVTECRKVIGKGTKIFKQKMLVLSQHIERVVKKQQLTQQLEYMKEQIKQVNKEFEDLDKLLN